MKDGTQWLEMKICGTCGKRFAVLYPTIWRFKRPQGTKKVFLCSYGCARKWDKGVEKVGMSEKSRKALELALAGGDPIGFLKDEGSKNPSAAWHSIKMQAKEKDPETFAKLPGTRTKKAEMHMAPIPEPITNIEVPVKNPNDIFEKIEIRSADSGMIYKRAEGGMTMILDGTGIFLNERTWKQLAEEIPKALKTLGVET